MLVFDRLQEIAHAVDPDDAPVHDEGHPITQAFRLFDIMGGQQNGGARPVQIVDKPAHLAGAGHVDAGGRFVQKQNTGLVDNSGNDGQLALHSFGIAAELAPGRCTQAELVEQFPGPFPTLGFFQTVEGGAEAEILITAQFRVEIAFVGNHPDQVLGSPRSFDAVQAADANAPRIGPGQTSEHIDGGGLTGPVGSEQAEQLARDNLKTQLIDRLDVRKGFFQSPDGNAVFR